MRQSTATRRDNLHSLYLRYLCRLWCGINLIYPPFMLQGSGDARMQPLYFLITTAGNDTNSICYEVHQKAIDIAEGRKVDPTFYWFL